LELKELKAFKAFLVLPYLKATLGLKALKVHLEVAKAVVVEEMERLAQPVQQDLKAKLALLVQPAQPGQQDLKAKLAMD
jgi:hypothetical protein